MVPPPFLIDQTWASVFNLQAADSQALPPLAVLYQDKVPCSGLGDVYWVASHAQKKLHDAPKDLQKRFIDTQRYDVHVAMASQLEDSGLVVLAMEHFRQAAELRPFDIALKVGEEADHEWEKKMRVEVL